MTIKDEVALRVELDSKGTDKDARLKDVKCFENVYTAFTNRGILWDSKQEMYKKFKMNDLFAREDLMRFVPQTVEIIVREALEPNLFIIDKFFEEIEIPRGSKIEIGAIGALEAGRVGQAGEYKTTTLDLDGGDMVAMTTDKYGLKISVTEEVIRDGLYDVVGVWLRAAGRALARLKEKTGAKLINQMGYNVMDNDSPSSSYIGRTTGRNIAGTSNGSMTVNDMFELYAYLLHRGFTPDTIMMHPLAWKTFMCDTEMREVVLEGATVVSSKMPSGTYAKGWGTSHGSLGIRTTATGYENTSGDTTKGPNAWTQLLNPHGNTMNIAPRYLPGPLEVVVTPHVPYEYGTRTAGTANETTSGSKSNIIMVDSMECGLIGQSLPVTIDEWKDPERDIQNLKLKEEWGLQLKEQGKAIAIARNISGDRNYNFENANNQTLAEIDRSPT